MMPVDLHAMGLNVLDGLSDQLPLNPTNGASQSSASNITEGELLRKELHEALVPSALRVPWTDSEVPVHLHFYYIRFIPIPDDRQYRMFGLFVKNPLPREVENIEVDLHLHHSRIVKTSLVPSGMIKFDGDEIILAQNFQEMSLKLLHDRSTFFCDFVLLGEKNESHNAASTFYLLLPVKMQSTSDDKIIDWEIVERCLASPVFGHSVDPLEGPHPISDTLNLRNGTFKTSDIMNSLVFTPHNKKYFFVQGINHEKNACSSKNEKHSTSEAYYRKRGVQFLYPEQPFLVAKRLPELHNLLIDRVKANKEVRESKEYLEEFPPELCALKIIGFSKDIGSSLTLFPSLMHHLENLLVAVELKDMLSTTIPEASDIRVDTVLQALTTQKCSARLSLERLEVLGDAFLKYAVGRHCFLSYGTIGEGQLTIMRSSIVKNLFLYELAIKNNLQVYMRDEMFDPSQFYALGRPCKVDCSVDTEISVHSCNKNKNMVNGVETNDVKCTKSHRWLSKKTIADVVESLAGAFLIEGGFRTAISFLRWIGIQVNFEVSDVQRVCEESKNMCVANDTYIAALETSIGHRFQHQGLLLQAFVHPSVDNHNEACYRVDGFFFNVRLEFLGDAALDYLVTSYFYSAYPEINPGHITDLRSSVVNNKSFAYIAVGRSFHLYLRHNSSALSDAIEKFSQFLQLPDSERDFAEEPACPKILGDIFESCIGAILVDTGFDLKLVWKIVLGLLEPALTSSTLQLDQVRELRELCQCVDLPLRLPKPLKQKDGYFVTVEVDVKDKTLTFSAVNNNSKAAQKMAAQKALSKLKALGFKHKRRSLQEILQSTRKEAAKLIGYNEEPILIPNVISMVKELSPEPEKTLELLPEPKNTSQLSRFQEKSPSKPSQNTEKALSNLPLHQEKALPNSQDLENTISNLSNEKKIEASPTARMQLYEICAANNWERPSFELYREEGPSHQMMFTYKVIVQVETIGSTNLECFSEPKQQKKAAQEHAAEGALWYLNHLGFLPKP